MPTPRKIDRLPSQLRMKLIDELKRRGFADYDKLTEDLNFWCEQEGIDIRIGKTAIHAFGQEVRDYVRMQEQSQDEIRAFFEQASMTDEANVQRVLFQQLTSIQYQMQKNLQMSGELVDPKGMKDLTSALNNLIRSTSLREAIVKAERREQSAKLEAAVASGDINAEAAAKARRIMGFAD